MDVSTGKVAQRKDSSTKGRGREARSPSPVSTPLATGVWVPKHLDGPGGQMPLVGTGYFERNVAPATTRKESQ